MNILNGWLCHETDGRTDMGAADTTPPSTMPTKLLSFRGTYRFFDTCFAYLIRSVGWSSYRDEISTRTQAHTHTLIDGDTQTSKHQTLRYHKENLAAWLSDDGHSDER